VTVIVLPSVVSLGPEYGLLLVSKPRRIDQMVGEEISRGTGKGEGEQSER
jgi:hypothetical protein